jgi:FAD synthase
MVRAQSLYLCGSWFESRQADMTYSGVAQKGSGKARELGFPTVNIPLEDLTAGIFAAIARIEGKKHHAVVYADQDRKVLEAHLLDFEGDLYGKEVEVELVAKVRNPVVFANDEEAKKAINADVKMVRELLTRVN